MNCAISPTLLEIIRRPELPALRRPKSVRRVALQRSTFNFDGCVMWEAERALKPALLDQAKGFPP